MNNRHAGELTKSHRCAADDGWGLWDRRDFILAGAAMGGLAMATHAARAGSATVSSPALVVADNRFAASRDFATQMAGERVAWIDGDITSLWYDELDLRWRRERTVVSGLTAYGAFFCLERLALDRGMRLAFKGEHRRVDPDTLSHAISGPADSVTPNAMAGLSSRDWAAQTARMAMAARWAEPNPVRRENSGRAAAEQPALLISWVLAPKPARRTQGEVA